MNYFVDLNTVVNNSMRLKIAACLALTSVILAGCSKKEETAAGGATVTDASVDPKAAPAAAPASETPGVERIPGENAVQSALKAKDYNTAVSRVLAMKNGLPSEMWSVYAELYTEVRNTLAAEAPTNPQAAQALVVLRASTAGR